MVRQRSDAIEAALPRLLHQRYPAGQLSFCGFNVPHLWDECSAAQPGRGGMPFTVGLLDPESVAGEPVILAGARTPMGLYGGALAHLARYGCLGICVGSGQGVALVLERVP